MMQFLFDNIDKIFYHTKGLSFISAKKMGAT